MHGYDDCTYVFGNTEKALLPAAWDKMVPKKSLLVLPVYEPELVISSAFGRRKMQFNFFYSGHFYRYFGLSDPRIRNYLERLPDGTRKLGYKATVVFSLTDKFRDGKYYKMAASIFL